MLFTAYLHGFNETVKHQTIVPDRTLMDIPEIIVDGDRYLTFIRRDYDSEKNELSVVYKEFSLVRSLSDFISINKLKEIEVIRN
jgi:hypothetical protein